MKANSYLIGNSTVITVSIYHDGVLVDPVNLIFTYELPDSTKITYTYGVTSDIVKLSTGIYSVTVNLNQAGAWKYRWATTSPSTGAIEGFLLVTPSIL